MRYASATPGNDVRETLAEDILLLQLQTVSSLFVAGLIFHVGGTGRAVPVQSRESNKHIVAYYNKSSNNTGLTAKAIMLLAFTVASMMSGHFTSGRL